MAVSKLFLIGIGVGASIATAGGVALYLTSGETIVNHISKEANLKNKKFITLVPAAQTHLEKKYSSSKDLNKPTKDSKPVEKIVDWCKESENIKFSSEADPNYLLIANWCFVNVNSLVQEANSKLKVYLSNEGESHTEWQTAWEAYNKDKKTTNLEITTTKFEHLNKQAKEAGGKDLYKWCKAQDEKKMYEENSEDTYKRYEKWCFKPQ